MQGEQQGAHLLGGLPGQFLNLLYLLSYLLPGLVLLCHHTGEVETHRYGGNRLSGTVVQFTRQFLPGFGIFFQDSALLPLQLLVQLGVLERQRRLVAECGQ